MTLDVSGSYFNRAGCAFSRVPALKDRSIFVQSSSPLTCYLRVAERQAMLALMAAEASAVITMRTLGFMGIWSVPKSENTLMVSEKQAAIAEAGHGLIRAAWRGETPEAVYDAVVLPFDRAARANRRRLSQRGFRRP